MSLFRIDTRKHIGVGLAICSAVQIAFLAVLLDTDRWLASAFAGRCAANAAAWLKEIYDEMRPAIHTSDPLDAEATIAGADLAIVFGAACLVVSKVLAGA